MDPDPRIRTTELRIRFLFASVAFKKPSKNIFFAAYVLKLHLHHSSMIKCHKESTKQQKSKFFLHFCCMMEGSGSVQNNDGSGTGRSRNKRIRIHNTDKTFWSHNIWEKYSLVSQAFVSSKCKWFSVITGCTCIIVLVYKKISKTFRLFYSLFPLLHCFVPGWHPADCRCSFWCRRSLSTWWGTCCSRTWPMRPAENMPASRLAIQPFLHFRMSSNMIWMVNFTTYLVFLVIIQGARGIAARFLTWSPASTVSPIMTKFSQYTPPLHLLLSTGVHLPARLKGPRQEKQRAVIVKIIRAVWGKMENEKFKKQGIWELQYRA